MKKKPHQWPTDGATMKYVDRVTDRLTMRIDKLLSRVRSVQSRLAWLEALHSNEKQEEE